MKNFEAYLNEMSNNSANAAPKKKESTDSITLEERENSRIQKALARNLGASMQAILMRTIDYAKHPERMTDLVHEIEESLAYAKEHYVTDLDTEPFYNRYLETADLAHMESASIDIDALHLLDLYKAVLLHNAQQFSTASAFERKELLMFVDRVDAARALIDNAPVALPVADYEILEAFLKHLSNLRSKRCLVLSDLEREYAETAHLRGDEDRESIVSFLQMRTAFMDGFHGNAPETLWAWPESQFILQKMGDDAEYQVQVSLRTVMNDLALANDATRGVVLNHLVAIQPHLDALDARLTALTEPNERRDVACLVLGHLLFNAGFIGGDVVEGLSND